MNRKSRKFYPDGTEIKDGDTVTYQVDGKECEGVVRYMEKYVNEKEDGWVVFSNGYPYNLDIALQYDSNFKKAKDTVKKIERE